MKHLGKACKDSGLLLSINAHLWGALFPLLNYGNAQQQEIYSHKLMTGGSWSAAMPLPKFRRVPILTLWQ